MPTLAATICRRVSRLVARNSDFSLAPDRRQTSSACSRRQWPSSSSSSFCCDSSRRLNESRAASGCCSGTASRKGSSKRNSLCSWSSCTGNASSTASSLPSCRRDCSTSLFSSTSSNSRLGKRSRMRGITCGNRYGPSVGNRPRRTVPASGSWLRRAPSFICSTSATMRRARSAASRPAGVSMTLRGARSTSDTPSSSSSFLICVDSVGWLTKHAAAARPKCLWSARASRYLRSRRFMG